MSTGAQQHGIDNIASRTRARIRQEPYVDVATADDHRSESPVRALARRGALEERIDPDTVPGTRNMTTVEDETISTEGAMPATDANQQHVPDEEDEVRVYVFAAPGRRGVDSLVSRQPRLTRLQPREKVVEVRRRRYRTRTGRYALEFEIRRVNQEGERRVPETMWVNQNDYEQLWRDGWLRTHNGDSEDDDRSEPETEQQDEPRAVRARGRE
ncbi:unnamed protein product [Phytophthora fragariaefolia]|uniref:Unnamed protein product n=1 Tax=Phytophthora fragariaefolia TaxID=1490495 RepID=A0A9W7D5Q8_9STRA|nr:unnamed protein product [Phytophthora fragariaefolia]